VWQRSRRVIVGLLMIASCAWFSPAPSHATSTTTQETAVSSDASASEFAAYPPPRKLNITVYYSDVQQQCKSDEIKFFSAKVRKHGDARGKIVYAKAKITYKNGTIHWAVGRRISDSIRLFLWRAPTPGAQVRKTVGANQITATASTWAARRALRAGPLDSACVHQETRLARLG